MTIIPQIKKVSEYDQEISQLQTADQLVTYVTAFNKCSDPGIKLANL